MRKIKILWSALKSFLKDDPLTYASSLAFYTVISLPAILLIAINILSTAYERNQVQQDLLQQLNRFLGPNTVDQAQIILENASLTTDSLVPQIIGWIVLFISASTVFISLQNGINKIWGVTPDPNSGLLKIFFDRILSFAMLVSIGFILLVSLVIDSILSVFQNYIITNFSQIEAVLIWVGNVLLSLLVTTTVFTLIFKTLPDVKTKWKNVWVGGLFTSLLFLVGKFFIGYYLSQSDIGSAYGASGSLVIFLSWVYYSSVIILFGSKFTYEYTLDNQKKIVAEDNAVFVQEKTIATDSIFTDELNQIKL